jgi:hypothetical protein
MGLVNWPVGGLFYPPGKARMAQSLSININILNYLRGNTFFDLH